MPDRKPAAEDPVAVAMNFRMRLCNAQWGIDYLKYDWCNTEDNAGGYSLRNAFTGFAMAALIAWMLTVINVITSAPIPETMKIQNDIVVL